MNTKPTGTPGYVHFDNYAKGVGIYPPKPAWMAFARQPAQKMPEPKAKPITRHAPQTDLF